MISRLVAFCVLGWLLGFLWFAVFLSRPAADMPTDGIVVLTGSAGRIERGLELLKAKQSDAMLVSGVDQDVKPGEFAQAYKVPRSLMRCCVKLGREAIDTRSNAVETSAWVDRRNFKTVRLITADWHMRRARYELSLQLKEPVTIISDAVVSKPSLAVLFREYNKYILRRAAGLFGI